MILAIPKKTLMHVSPKSVSLSDQHTGVGLSHGLTASTVPDEFLKRNVRRKFPDTLDEVCLVRSAAEVWQYERQHGGAEVVPLLQVCVNVLSRTLPNSHMRMKRTGSELLVHIVNTFDQRPQDRVAQPNAKLQFVLVEVDGV